MQISDKSILPVTKVYYGPLEFEMDQMKIVVGSLVCQPDPEKQNGIEDRIENIELQNNRTQDGWGVIYLQWIYLYVIYLICDLPICDLPNM